ncbi:unnamed protein product [Boreogadus saida]
MVSVRSSELGPMAWDAVTKRQLFLQKVSSKLGPGPRQQAGQRAPGASCATGPAAVWGSGAPAQGGSGPRPAQAESSSLGKEAASAGGGAPGRARLSHNQGLLKPRPISERSSSLATQYSVTANSKAASANPLAGSLPCGRSLTAMLPPSSSKLPVKGLPRSLSSSSLGSSAAQNNKEAPAGGPADEKPGRGAPPVGNHSPANPPGPGTAVSTDANANANNNACNNASTNASSTAASTRAPGIRCRAFSVQNRTNTTGLKPPAVTGSSPARTTNHAAAGHKTAASANPASPAKPSQNPFQRSGSARLTAKGLFRNLQLLSGCRKNTVVFHAGLEKQHLRVYKHLNTSSPPIRTSSSPHQNLLTPHQNVLTPHQNLLIPHQNLLTPHQNLLIPHQNLLTPHQNLLIPHQNLLTPHQNLLIPPSAVWVQQHCLPACQTPAVNRAFPEIQTQRIHGCRRRLPPTTRVAGSVLGSSSEVSLNRLLVS